MAHHTGWYLSYPIAALTLMFTTIGSFGAEISIKWLAAKAPAERLGCIAAKLENDTPVEAQRVLEETTERLVQKAIRLKIAAIGEPFIYRVASGQTEGVYPIFFDFCMPLKEELKVMGDELHLLNSPEHSVRVGFCSSADPEDCQPAIEKASVSPPPKKPDVDGMKAEETASTPGAAPAGAAKLIAPAPDLSDTVGIRSGVWQSDNAPADAEAILAAVYRLWPPAEAPFGAGVDKSKNDEILPPPRELGKIPGVPAQGGTPTHMKPPAAQPVTGLVFALSPQ